MRLLGLISVSIHAEYNIIIYIYFGVFVFLLICVITKQVLSLEPDLKLHKSTSFLIFYEIM